MGFGEGFTAGGGKNRTITSLITEEVKEIDDFDFRSAPIDSGWSCVNGMSTGTSTGRDGQLHLHIDASDNDVTSAIRELADIGRSGPGWRNRSISVDFKLTPGLIGLKKSFQAKVTTGDTANHNYIYFTLYELMGVDGLKLQVVCAKDADAFYLPGPTFAEYYNLDYDTDYTVRIDVTSNNSASLYVNDVFIAQGTNAAIDWNTDDGANHLCEVELDSVAATQVCLDFFVKRVRILGGRLF